MSNEKQIENMTNEKQVENLKIENLQDLADISELNSELSQFQTINEFIKQSLMFIAIKKGKKETISENDLALVRLNVGKMNNVINNLLKN